MSWVLDGFEEQSAKLAQQVRFLPSTPMEDELARSQPCLESMRYLLKGIPIDTDFFLQYFFNLKKSFLYFIFVQIFVFRTINFNKFDM